MQAARGRVSCQQLLTQRSPPTILVEPTRVKPEYGCLQKGGWWRYTSMSKCAEHSRSSMLSVETHQRGMPTPGELPRGASLLGSGLLPQVGAIHKARACWFVCFQHTRRADYHTSSTVGMSKAPAKSSFIPALVVNTSTRAP